jgi:translocation and assembly module TamA
MSICRNRTLIAVLGVLLLLSLIPLRSAYSAPVQVVITGVEGALRENVEAALALPPGLVREGRVDRRWLERFRNQIPQVARRALEPFGYYEAQISVTTEEVSPEVLRLRVEIEPGVPVRVEEVRVELTGPGGERSALREKVAQFPLRQGDILRHDLYEESKGEIRSTALDLGYLAAEYSEHQILVWRLEASAHIHLVLETGPLHYFGEVHIEGAEEYPPEFLRRYVTISHGEVFSYRQLGQTQYHFLDSDRFRDVIVSPQIDEAVNGEVPVTIFLSASRPKRLRPGIGYATDTGPRFSLRYRDLNFMRRGHELEGDLLLAEARQSIGTGYIIPSLRDVDSQTAFRVGFDREDLDFERRTTFAEVERTRAFAGGRSASVYLRLFQESFTVGEVSDRSRYVLPGIRFSQRRYPQIVRPERGYSFTVEVRGSSELLGSDSSILQFLGSANSLIPLSERVTLLTRVQGGVTVQDVSLSEVPPSLRFFAGGDQSVRGYAYQSIGLVDDSGEVIGGRNLLVGSIEIERALGENWGVAAFYDAGDAFNTFENIDIRHGAGLGVRRYTMVGPIKLDVARQIGISDPSYRLHISIGFVW